MGLTRTCQVTNPTYCSNVAILPVDTKDLPISPRFSPYIFSSRCNFSTSTTRRPMAEFYLLAFSRFPVRTAGRPGSSEVSRNPLTRWDVSSTPANGIFLTKKTKKLKEITMPNGWRAIKSLVHKIRLHGRRGKGMTESFSREKLRHAPQKGGG